MSKDIICFEAAKDRRTLVGINANQEQWEHIHDKLIKTLITSGLYDTSLISAALCALIDVLAARGVNLEKAKEEIALSLNCFFDRGELP